MLVLKPKIIFQQAELYLLDLHKTSTARSIIDSKKSKLKLFLQTETQ